MPLRVGFIGLGNIGRPMAERLVGAGLETTVFDRADAPVEALVARGAKAAADPRQLAAVSDVIGICVRDDADVHDVVLGPAGVLAGSARGSVVAVHSTVLPRTVQALAAPAAEAGVGLVDACVTGGAAGAARGALTVIAGGEAADLETCAPAFGAFAQRVIHTGPLGTGATAKLCNNLMTYLAWTAAFEATALARAAGLADGVLEEVGRASGHFTDPMKAFLALQQLPPDKRREEAMQSMLRGFVEVAEKDLAHTLSLARQCGLALPGTALASQSMGRLYGLEDEGRR